MDNTVTRISDTRIELFDDQGKLIGTIATPIAKEVLGPGREKVYLARRPAARTRGSHAA